MAELSLETPGPSTVVSSSYTPRRSYLSRAEKVAKIAKTLQRIKWSFEEFIEAWVGTDGREYTLPFMRRYYGQKQRREALCCTLRDISHRGVKLEVSRSQQFTTELDALVGHETFGKFNVSMDLDTLDFKKAAAVIEQVAPVWFTTFQSLLGNQRQSQPSYSTLNKREMNHRRLYMITSMICFARQQNNSNILPSCLDLYLQGSGVPRRVIESLAGLGICHSYVHGNQLMAKVAQYAKEQLKLQGKNPQAVVAYDNINFMDRKRHEETGHRPECLAFTNAMYAICGSLPSTGLRPDMHNSSIPLTIQDIAGSPGFTGDDGIGPRISTSLIADAIRRLHETAIGKIFCDDTASKYPVMPTIERLPAQQAQFWQFEGITADESTHTGTAEVHESIFIKQLGLQPSRRPDKIDDYSRRLFLVHGDQLTTHRIRAAQQEHRRAGCAYDRRKWILAVPAWFHILMNLLNTVIRTHWSSPPGQSDTHCILGDATRWNRSQISKDSLKYHLMEPIVAQGFTSRVVAMFYTNLRRRNLLSNEADSIGRLEDVNTVIESMSTAQFLEIVEEIRTTAFTHDAWSKATADLEFRTMVRLLQEVELFLTVRHAVKYGDIGLLRRTIDPLIITFFGARQHNYGREMLYYRWQLSSANQPELQRAILASGLVNWVGQPSTFKPIDLALEHLNGHCKIDLRNFKNSTHDIGLVFQRTALCNTFIRILRTKFETLYGETMPSGHTPKVAIPDMFFRAWQLYANNQAERQECPTVDGSTMFDSEDIFKLGVDVLESRIAEFNAQYVDTLQVKARLPEPDSVNPFTDLRAFAEAVHSGYDAVDDILDTQLPDSTQLDQDNSL